MLLSSLPLIHLWNFLLPLSAPDRNSRFRVCFHFQSLSLNCLRFNKNLTASTSLLSMKQLIVFSLKKKQPRLRFICKLFYLTCAVDGAWHGMEDDFSIFHAGNFLPFHFHSILKIFHSIQKFSSIFHSILPHHRNFRLEAMQRIFCSFASSQCCKQPLVKVRQQY